MARTAVRQNSASFWDRFYYYVFEADYLADFNRYLPWRYALGCLVMAAAAAGVCGWLIHEQAYVLLACIGLAIVLGLLWPGLSILGIRAELDFDRQRVREGEPVQVRLRIQNAWPLGIWGLRLRGGFTPDSLSGRTDDCSASLAVAPGWRITEFAWEWRPPCRGEYPLTIPRIATGFPFGLWEASRSVEVKQRLIVWPTTFPLHLLPEAAANDRTTEGLTAVNRVGTSGDVLGVRPYRRGDPLRRIHWGQSARHDRLIICEQQATACPRVQVVVDLEREHHEGKGPNSSREWAVRVAASIAEAALRHASLVELVLPEAVVPYDVGSTQQRRILDALARATEGSSRGLERMMSQPTCHHPSGLQLIITTFAGLKKSSEKLAPRRGRFVIAFAEQRFAGKPTPEPENGAGHHFSRIDALRRVFRIDCPNHVVEEMQAIWKELLCAD